MRVTVDVKGEETHEVDLGAPTDAPNPPATPTYADLLAAIDYSPHEVSVLVDGHPVPEDQPVATDEVTVLRLIKGG